MDSLGSRLAKPWRLVGFGLLQTWVLLIALSPASFTDNAFFLQDSYTASLLLSGGLFASSLAFIVLDAFHSIYRSEKALMAACVVAGLGTVLMLWSGAPAPAVVTGIVLANAGSAFLGLWWGKRWATLPTDRTALHLSVSSLFACVAFVTISTLGGPIAIALITLLPLFSGLVLLATADAPERPQPNPEDTIFPSLWKVVVMLVTIPVAYSLVRSFFFKSNLATFGLGNLPPMLSYGCFALVILAFVLHASRRQSIVVLYRVTITVMSLGFVALLALPEDYRFTAMGAIMLSYTLFDELTWFMHPRISIRVGRAELSLFGWGRILFRAAAFTGVLLGGWLLHQAWFADSADVVACAIMTALVVLLFMNALTASDFSLFVNPVQLGGSPAPPAAPMTEGRLDEQCRRIAQEYGLSRRELDVLPLLARGRSLPVIEEQLCISNSTARTHARNIYRKLGIHSKQELIDMVESAEGPSDN